MTEDAMSVPVDTGDRSPRSVVNSKMGFHLW